MSKSRKNIYIAVLCFIIVAISLMMSVPTLIERVAPASTTAQDQGITVIIDAGHGGIDGGAVGINKAVEKDINLAIALKLKEFMVISGFDVILTRDSDISIHDAGLTKTREIKRSDLHNRLGIMEENPDAIFISIHQNSFTQSQYKGTQVFYGENHPESRVLADTIQRTIAEGVQPDNQRVVKQTGDNIFLLYETKSIAIMVECGFLSNPEEADMLLTEEYQDTLAYIIYAGVIRYLVQE